MKTVVYSTKRFDRASIEPLAKQHGLSTVFLEARLGAETARLAEGAACACLFVNDRCDAEAMRRLAEGGVRLLALRSAGFNHVDLKEADRLGITVARVPAYSPHSVAEHAIALLLCLNRKIHRAYHRVREGNFAIDGLMGFDLHGRTVGVVGTGKIGMCFARIVAGFGCRLLAFDPFPHDGLAAIGGTYDDLPQLLAQSDIVTLHCPLTPETQHLIDANALRQVKRGVLLINTSRGGLIDTPAAIEALKDGRLGGMGIDVYEEEGDCFFRDLSDVVLQDDVLARLLTFPNVLVTAHQAFFTQEAVDTIAETTIGNIVGFRDRGLAGIPPENLVQLERHVASAADA